MQGVNEAVQLKLVTLLEWGEPIDLDIVEVQPPKDGSFFEVPGPMSRLIRPYLELFTSPSGIAARVVRGDNQVLPFALLISEQPTVIELSEPPFALSVRTDGGIWVLDQSGLKQLDATGNLIQVLSLFGMKIVGGLEDSVWVIGLDEVWFVANDGHDIEGPYPWTGGLGSVNSGNCLCAFEKKDLHRIQCLNPNGETTYFSLPLSLQPFEKLLAFENNQVITLDAATLRFYDTTGVFSEIIVQSAGLTSASEPFISGRDGDEVLLQFNQESPRRFSIPSDVLESIAVSVVSVRDSQVLVYGMHTAAWYENYELEDMFVVDGESYQNDIFPHLWTLGIPNFAVAIDGRVILSSTGPTGLVLISVSPDL
ncbi:MAG: hypothetical protein F6K30_11185 [Cyanothece sp. SIO2G6]|nr:hypothetical protein [Cyanothece sp. SIO2G6]